MSEPGFVVGGRYASTAGDYVVVAIDDGSVRIRYDNGFEMSLPAQGLWAQYEALIQERMGRTGPPAPSKPAPGAADSAPRVASPSRSAAASREPAARKSGTASGAGAAATGIPKPKKGAGGGDAGFYTAVGYLALGCELTSSVAGRDYPAFAQRYTILTGRSLITPHAGLDIHERPTHKMGAELSVRFPASPHELSYFDFGPGVKPERVPDTAEYSVTNKDVVERLLKLGFDLGPNTDPAPIREKVPEAQRINFDNGVRLRRVSRR